MKFSVAEFCDICAKVIRLLSKQAFIPLRQNINDDNGNYDFLLEYRHNTVDFCVNIFDSGTIVILFCLDDKNESWELKWEDAERIPKITLDFLGKV